MVSVDAYFYGMGIHHTRKHDMRRLIMCHAYVITEYIFLNLSNRNALLGTPLVNNNTRRS